MADSSRSGLINVHKPPEYTSRQVVDQCRRLLQIKRVGHAGTLDPMATGVLVIGTGHATKLIRFVQRFSKSYLAELKLGVRSDTDDIRGKLTETEDVTVPSHDALLGVLKTQLGEIKQRPPAFSALKIDGERAYKLARRGIPVPMDARTAHVHQIELLRYEFPVATLNICCGSGTYIRSIARDIGDLLHVGAVMSGLVRTAIGPFRLESALSIDEQTVIENHIVPVAQVFNDVPSITLTTEQWCDLRYGRTLALTQPKHEREFMALTESGEFAAWLNLDESEKSTGRYRTVVNWVPWLAE